MTRRRQPASSAPAFGRANFSRSLLAWYDRYGRHDLPWQRDPTPYRVWVSEIMLQQTQVGTVIAYYERFLWRFPDVRTLARAPLDEVLQLWAGLGYYARARNLHKTAQIIVAEHRGRFPDRIDALAGLPGIGRSTAGAILALACDQRHPILDGNVRRALARYHAVGGWPGDRAAEQRLWECAEQHTPARRVAAYTQAIMDLGATVCTRMRPRCEACPVSAGCRAHAEGRETAYPAPRPRKTRPVRTATFLIVCDRDGAVLLERRPPTGIWGGLWSLPELPPTGEPEIWCRQNDFKMLRAERWPALRHTFSHFHLDIQPVRLEVRHPGRWALERPGWLWYKKTGKLPVGVAAPVKTLLNQLRKSPPGDPT